MRNKSHNEREKSFYHSKWAICVALFFFAWSLSVSAQSITDKISISCNNEPLATVLKKIEKETKFKVLFAYDEVQMYKVSVSAKRQPVKNVLSEVLRGTNLKYATNGKFIQVYSTKTTPLQIRKSQTRRGYLRGTVCEENGDPLIGATVRIKDTNDGVPTDANGRFQLAVNEEYITLLVSYVGKKDVEFKAHQGSNVRIVLEDNTNLLGECVVTGYQTISKERSTASFNIVRGEQIKENASSRGSILESLEGMTPGFTVNLSGDAISKYSVRGLTSINSSKEPLFVLDGVPISSSDMESMISPNDIQTITILKDATAVSIWGSRAANGVVVIVTKKGDNTNGKVKVTYDGSMTFKGKPDVGYYDLMDSKTFIKNVKERFDEKDYQDAFPWSDISTQPNKGISLLSLRRPVVYPHELICYNYLNGKISLDERNKELDVLASQNGYQSYQDELMSNNWMQNHTISLSAGNNKFNIFGSIGFEGKTGDYKNTDNTYKLNMRQTYQIAKWLNWDLSLNASHTDSKSHFNPFTSVTFSSPFERLLPYAVLRNADGSEVNFNTYDMYEPYRTDLEGKFGISMDDYPIQDFNSCITKVKTTRIRANTGLHADIWKGISYEVRFQYLRTSSNSEEYYPEDSWYIRSLRYDAIDPDGNQYMPKHGGDFSTDNGFNTDWTVRNQLMYDHSFNEMKHQITALAGCEYRESKTKGYYSFLRGYNYQTMSQTNYDITAAKDFFQNYYGHWGYVDTDYSKTSEQVLRYVSYYANFAYTYDQKYNINANIRIDQSNLFGTDVNDQYKPIGSVGLSWKMSEEKFMKKFTWLDNLTLRLGYGFAGNSPDPGMGGPYDIISPYNHSMLGSNSGYVISSPANKKLSWEKTLTWNYGIDFSVLNHRIFGSFDIYNKKTTDLLANQALNPLVGFESIYANVGSMTNKGFELSLTSRNISVKDFNWTTMLNLSYNKNKVTSYYNTPSTSIYDAIEKHYVEGYPGGAIFAMRWAGLTHDAGVPQAYNNAGDKVYNYYELTSDDVHYAGTVIPKWTGSLTNRLEYKNFEMSAMFIFNLGHRMYTNPYLIFYSRMYNNQSNEYDKRWRQPGDELTTNVPSAYVDPDYSGRAQWFGESIYSQSDVSIRSASYMKLRELSFGYTFPKALCSKMSMQNLRLRFTAYDVFRITANKKGIDPECYNLFSASRTDQYGTYYSIGLTANF
jgi:TonB-linked SusC/RagA family outer membrane protein